MAAKGLENEKPPERQITGGISFWNPRMDRKIYYTGQAVIQGESLL